MGGVTAWGSFGGGGVVQFTCNISVWVGVAVGELLRLFRWEGLAAFLEIDMDEKDIS